MADKFTKEEIGVQVRQIITDLVGFTHEEVADGKDLMGDLHCDALDLVELAMVLEEQFDIDISEENAQGAHTVGDWIGTVWNELEKKGRVGK